MRFLAIVLAFALWQGDAARAGGRTPTALARSSKHLTSRISAKDLRQELLDKVLAGMNAGTGEKVIIGIDLGTTNSAVSIYDNDAASIVPIGADKRTMPSVVSFAEGKEGVGEVALQRRSTDPKSTFFSFKRLMGKKLDEVDQAIIDSLPFDVVADANGWAVVQDGDKIYTPVELSARILSKLKQIVEEQGYEIVGAVITIPAYFDDAQRQATLDSGKIANLEVKRLVAEPTAAALAHGFKHGKVAIYDLGGGTFDVSIVNLDDLGEEKYAAEVVATSGNSNLGGDNFDERVIEYFLEGIKEESGVDVSDDANAIAILRDEAKKAKELLSESESIDINIPFVAFNQSAGRPITFNGTLSRARFNEMTSDLVDETRTLTKSTLEEAGLTVADIDAVVPVGGSSRLTAVEEMLEELFGADKISKRDNPDEVVAFGAGIQAGVLSGKVAGLVLLDVTPFSLGLEVLSSSGPGDTKEMSVLIPKNTKVPIKKSQTYTTSEKNQTAVDIKVLQGESKHAEANKEIGNFRLDNIPPADKGVPQIAVTFDFDASGILNVSAKDVKTGEEASLTIEGSSSLSEAEIEELMQKQAAYAEKDKQLDKVGEQYSQLDNLIVGAEKILKNNSDKLDKDMAVSLQNGLSGAQSALKEALAQKEAGDYKEAIQTLKSAIDGFEPLVHEVSEEKIYGEGEASQEE